jgi:hypothetical protein
MDVITHIHEEICLINASIPSPFKAELPTFFVNSYWKFCVLEALKARLWAHQNLKVRLWESWYLSCWSCKKIHSTFKEQNFKSWQAFWPSAYSSHAFGFVFTFSCLFILCVHFLKAPVLIFLLILIHGMLVCIASFVIVLLLHPSLSITFVMLFYSSSSWFLSLGCIQVLTSFYEWSHKLTFQLEQMFTLGFLILLPNSLYLHWRSW